jgi:hypothetical protein
VITENAPAVNHDQQAAYHKQKANEHSQAAKSATGPEKQAHFAAAAAHGEAVSDHKDAAYTQSRSPNPYEQVHPFTGEHYNDVAGKANESSRKAEQMSAATKQAAAAPVPAEVAAPAPAVEAPPAAPAPSKLPTAEERAAKKQAAADQAIKDLSAKQKEHAAAIKQHKKIAAGLKDSLSGSEKRLHQEAADWHAQAVDQVNDALSKIKEVGSSKFDEAKGLINISNKASATADRLGRKAHMYSEHSKLANEHDDKALRARQAGDLAAHKAHKDAYNKHLEVRHELISLNDPDMMKRERQQAMKASEAANNPKAAPAPAPAVEAPPAALAPAAPAAAPAQAPVEVPSDFKKYASEVKAHQKAAAKQHKMAGAPGLDPRVAAEYARARDVHQQAAEHYQRAMRDGDYNALNEARRVGNADIRATEKHHRKIAADHLERGNAAKTPEEGTAHMDAYAQHLAAAEGHKVAFEMANPDLKANAQSMSDAAHQASRQLMNAPAAPAAPAPMPEAPAAPAPAPEVPSADMAHQNRVQSTIAEHNRLAEEHGQKAAEHAQLAQSGTPSQQAGHQNAANEHATAQDQHQRVASDWERNHEQYRQGNSGLSSQADYHSQRAHSASREAVNPGSTDYVPKINHQQIGWALKDQQAEHINHAAKNEYPEAKQAAHSDAARAFRVAHEANQAAHDLYNAPRGEFNPRAYRDAVDHARNLTSQAEGLGEMAHGMPQTAPAPAQEEDDIPITVEAPGQEEAVPHGSYAEQLHAGGNAYRNVANDRKGRKHADAHDEAADAQHMAAAAHSKAHLAQVDKKSNYSALAQHAQRLTDLAAQKVAIANNTPLDHVESEAGYKAHAAMHRQIAAKHEAEKAEWDSRKEKNRLQYAANEHKKAADHYDAAASGNADAALRGYEAGQHEHLAQANEHRKMAAAHLRDVEWLKNNPSVTLGKYHQQALEYHQEAAQHHQTAADHHQAIFEKPLPYQDRKDDESRKQGALLDTGRAETFTRLALNRRGLEKDPKEYRKMALKGPEGTP